MRPINFSEIMTALYNAIVNDIPINFDKVYLKDKNENFHKVIQPDLIDDRFRCDDGYWECYDWVKEDSARLYVE